jgi:hypothetical protein
MTTKKNQPSLKVISDALLNMSHKDLTKLDARIGAALDSKNPAAAAKAPRKPPVAPMRNKKPVVTPYEPKTIDPNLNADDFAVLCKQRSPGLLEVTFKLPGYSTATTAKQECLDISSKNSVANRAILFPNPKVHDVEVAVESASPVQLDGSSALNKWCAHVTLLVKGDTRQAVTWVQLFQEKYFSYLRAVAGYTPKAAQIAK